MFLHQAFNRAKDGHFEINMSVIRQMAVAFDSGCHSDECVIAKAIMAAYEHGIDDGIRQSEERQMQTAMLLMHTGGTA